MLVASLTITAKGIQMTLTVHSISGAPRGWRVLVGLALKGLNYDVHYLEASKREHKTPEFLKINPRGEVPVLDADGLLIRESIAILAWLDRQHPDRPLFGETPEDVARIWQLTMECSNHLRAAVNDLLYPILVENIALPERASERMAELQAAGDSMHAECRYLDKLLNDQSFLCGQRPSTAEAIVFPEIRLIQRAIDRKGAIMTALGFDDIAYRYPRLFAWLDRVASLDGMHNTLPIHW